MASHSDGGQLAEPLESVIIVDHGSRRVESNEMLHEFADLYRRVLLPEAWVRVKCWFPHLCWTKHNLMESSSCARKATTRLRSGRFDGYRLLAWASRGVHRLCIQTGGQQLASSAFQFP